MDVGEPYRTKRSQDSGLQTQVGTQVRTKDLGIEHTSGLQTRYRTHVRTTESGIEHMSGLQTQV